MSEDEAERVQALSDELYDLESIDEVLSRYVDAHSEEFFSD